MNPASDNDGEISLPAIQQEALAWFARMQDSRVTGAERAACDAWLKADPAHAEAYTRLRSLWQAPEFEAALNLYAAEALPPPRSRRQWRRRSQRWAAAASVLLLLGWGLTAAGWIERWRADYTTLAGAQRHIVLADGSHVTLNTDSALAVDYSDASRGVRLLAGEAFFDVSHDSARPFIVSSGEVSVRVVGTRFSVLAGETTTVSVESGIVACRNGRGAAVQVVHGQRVSLSSREVSVPESIDSLRAFSWLKGRLAFKDQPLASVLAEVDRYHPGAVLVVNSTLAQTPVTGNYKLGDTAAIIQSLATATGGQVTTFSRYLTIVR